MMLTPIALTNPTMTALGTNRSMRPPFKRPATIITMPVRIARVERAPMGSRSCPMLESAITMLMAPVACTAMKVLDVKSAPPARPKR